MNTKTDGFWDVTPCSLADQYQHLKGIYFFNILFNSTVNCQNHVCSVGDEWMNIEHQWSDINRGKPKYLETNTFQSHFVHSTSHMDWYGFKPGPPAREAGN